MHCKKHSAAVFSIEMVTVSESFLSLIDLDINFLETFIKIFIYICMKKELFQTFFYS